MKTEQNNYMLTIGVIQRLNWLFIKRANKEKEVERFLKSHKLRGTCDELLLFMGWHEIGIQDPLYKEFLIFLHKEYNKCNLLSRLISFNTQSLLLVLCTKVMIIQPEKNLSYAHRIRYPKLI